MVRKKLTLLLMQQKKFLLRYELQGVVFSVSYEKRQAIIKDYAYPIGTSSCNNKL